MGLDVAKGATEGQAFLDKGRPYGPHFRIEHTMEGFAQFHARLQELARAAGCPPTMVLESTGPYHAPVVRFLVDYGYAYVLLNPLISTRPSSRPVCARSKPMPRMPTVSAPCFTKKNWPPRDSAGGNCWIYGSSPGSGRP